MKKKRGRRRASDADLFFGSSERTGRSERHRRKDAQLCAQVCEAVAMVLADSSDPAFDGVWVVEALPAPNIGHLRVIVAVPDDADGPAIGEKLSAMHGAMRFAVTETIHRKKAPTMSFFVVPMESLRP